MHRPVPLHPAHVLEGRRLDFHMPVTLPRSVVAGMSRMFPAFVGHMEPLRRERPPPAAHGFPLLSPFFRPLPPYMCRAMVLKLRRPYTTRSRHAKARSFRIRPSPSRLPRKKRTRAAGAACRGAFETSQRVCDHGRLRRGGQVSRPEKPGHHRRLLLVLQGARARVQPQVELLRDRLGNRTISTRSSGTGSGRGRRKPFRKSVEERAWARLGIEDPHAVLGDNATPQPRHRPQRKPPPPAHRAPRDRDPRRQGQLDARPRSARPTRR